VAPGGTTSFGVVFHPTSTGLRQALISVDSDDGDEGEYGFLIEGVGTDGAADSPPAQNFAIPQDVNGDLFVTPTDLLVLFNAMLHQSALPLDVTPLVASASEPAASVAAKPGFYLDVDGNGLLSPRDALLVINHLLQQSAAANTAVSPAASVSLSSVTPALQVFAIDQALGQLEEPSADIANELVFPTDSPTVAVATARAASLPLSTSEVRDVFAAGEEDESEDELDLSWE